MGALRKFIVFGGGSVLMFTFLKGMDSIFYDLDQT